MSTSNLVLWCDSSTNTLYSGWNSQTPAPTPVFKQGDNVSVEIHWVRSNSGSQMEEVVFPPSASVKLAIGLIDVAPTSGSFTLSYGGNTTSTLAYNATAEQFASALNALASITAEGGVSVVKSNNQYKIVWNTVGATANTLTSNADLLSPITNWSSVVYRTGSATKSQIVLFKLRQAPVAACTAFTTTPDPTINVESLGGNTWVLKQSGSIKSGTYRITFTRAGVTSQTWPIPFDASPDVILSAMKAANALATGGVVTKFSGGYETSIYMPSVTSLSVSTSLTGFSSVVGQLSLNTAELQELISGNNSTTAVMEVEVDIDGDVQTIAQSNAFILNDLIDQSAYEMVELGQVIPAEAIVRYDTSQTLTSAEKLQARTNIGAGEQAGIDSIDARVTAIENDYATGTALTSGLAGKANSVHTHVSTDITDSTSVGRTLLTAASASAQRTALGLGTMAVETASNYATVSSLSSYLTSSSAASTYLTQANAITLYISSTESTKIPTQDEKDALVGLSYSATAPSSSNVYLTKADHQTNFQSQTHAIAPNTGTDHNASNVIATGIIASPDSARTWLATVCFNYQATDADLRSDIFWADTSHELNFAPEGTLTPSLIFKRNSFEFVLMAGETGFEIWSTAHAAFSTLAGELYISYRALD